MELTIPVPVLEACLLLASHRWQAYLVGGGIRDSLLGLIPNDWDLATDADPLVVSRIFQQAGYHVIPTGLRFGTVTVWIDQTPLEITTFRVEQDYLDGRRPSQVRFVGKIEDDLARRDFTINALAYDPLRRQMRDPFGGITDLIAGVVRAVGEPEQRLTEDPLRMLRCVRCAANYGYLIEEHTRHALIRNSSLIRGVSSDRIRDELNRIILSPNYLSGLENLKETGLLFQIIPELQESWLFKQYNPAHQYSVLTHTFEALRYTTDKLSVRLAVLLHDIAKPRCFSRSDDGRGHFYGHNIVGAEMAEGIMRGLHYNNQLIRQVTTLIREHMLELGMGLAGIRRMVGRVGLELVPDLLIVRRADIMTHSTELVMRSLAEFDRFRVRMDQVLTGERVFTIRDLVVSGVDIMDILGCQSGPLVGKLKAQLWNEVLADPEKNRRGYLRKRIVELAGVE